MMALRQILPEMLPFIRTEDVPFHLLTMLSTLRVHTGHLLSILVRCPFVSIHKALSLDA